MTVKFWEMRRVDHKVWIYLHLACGHVERVPNNDGATALTAHPCSKCGS